MGLGRGIDENEVGWTSRWWDFIQVRHDNNLLRTVLVTI